MSAARQFHCGFGRRAGRTIITRSRMTIVRRAFLALVIVFASAIDAGAAGLSSSGTADEFVVPSSMCGSWFIIPIEVDGREKGSRVTLQALFDTGGAQLSIDPGTVERLWGRKVSHGDPVTLRKATAGPMNFGTLRPRAWSMTHLSRAIGVEIDLFLPFRAFRTVLLTLDFPRHEIRVAKGRLPRPDGIEVLDARGPDKRPYLRIVIGGRERLLLVDSGASSSIYIRNDGALSWELDPLPIRVTQGMESVHFHDVGRLSEEIDIAGVRVSKPIVVLTDETELLGTKVMARFAWTFDRRSRRMRIRPSSAERLEFKSLRGTGAVLAPRDAGYEIVRILAETPAEAAGLQIGDLVVAMNGTRIYEPGCARWDDSKRAEVITLTVQRDHRSFDVTLPVVVLVP